MTSAYTDSARVHQGTVANYYSIIGQILSSVSLCVTESVTRNELKALQIAIFHRSSPNLPPR